MSQKEYFSNLPEFSLIAINVRSEDISRIYNKQLCLNNHLHHYGIKKNFFYNIFCTTKMPYSKNLPSKKSKKKDINMSKILLPEKKA